MHTKVGAHGVSYQVTPGKTAKVRMTFAGIVSGRVRATKPGQKVNLYLLDTVGNAIESNDQPAARALIDRPNPIDGAYYYLVVNGASATSGKQVSYSLRVYNVSARGATITARPNPVNGVQARPATVQLSWPAPKSNLPYLGIVRCSTTDEQTLISIG